MSETSANLILPYLAAGQAQKHVTVNESLVRLDALVQLSVVSATTTAQPASPSDGQLYILPSGKTGAAWGAMSNGALAYYVDGAWQQITPREGWIAFAKGADRLLLYTGSAWSLFSVGNLVTVSATDRLLGRDTTGAGAAEELSVSGGIEFTGAGGVQRSALSGDITAAAGSNATTIANDAVTYAKLQNISATDKVLGRATAGAGDAEEIAFTTQARQLCDDASFQAMCATLGTWRVLGASAVAASVTGTTSETALATVNVPAGAMGVNGILRVTALFSFTNNANNKTLRIRFGGASGTQYLATSQSTQATLQAQVLIRNRNNAASQIGAQNGSTPFGPSPNANTTSAINTALAQDLVLSGALANGADTVTLESYLVELLGT